MAAYHETHEPPHCPTCECGADELQIAKVASERDSAQRKLAAYEQALDEQERKGWPTYRTVARLMRGRIAEILSATSKEPSP